MSVTEESKGRAAEELQSALEARENARREEERRTTTNLNQGMDHTGHEAKHAGINWGPSFKIRRKKAKRQQAPKE